MKITGLQAYQEDERHGVAATLTWEDTDRPPMTLHFATEPAFADSLTLDPHAFLVAALVPAMRHREKRIWIDAAICPQLRDGLLTAMAWLCRWYPPHDRRLALETRPAIRFPRKRALQHTAAFLSGGIDSLAMLHHNRRTFPAGHPFAIRSCLTVHGFDIGGRAGGHSENDYFARTLQALSGITRDARATLIPVYTNVRHLDDDNAFWMTEFHGAALASVAHAFSARLSTVLIASSDGLNDPIPWGSHPLLDPNYGSLDLRVVHDGIRFSRFDKLKQIADWDAAIVGLRVCTHNPSSGLNCGRCLKCILTMTQLLALEKLDRNRSFPVKQVTPEMVDSLWFTRGYHGLFFGELMAPLAAVGRDDLVAVIRKKIRQYHLFFKWAQTKNLRGRLKEFDQRYLAGRLARLYRGVAANRP